MSSPLRAAFPLAFLLSLPAPALAQGECTVFADANRNGIQDPGERGVAGLGVRVLGVQGVVDQALTTDADGTAAFPALGAGRFLVDAIEQPAFWPSMQSLAGDPPPVPDFPVGRHRFGHTRRLLDAAAAASGGSPLHHVSIGDSVAFGFNFCGSLLGQNGYVQPVNGRLGEAAPAASLAQLAVPGYLTTDLLCPSCSGNVLDAVAEAPDVITISIGGNDFLDVDGNAPQSALALARIRQNLQEILSGLQGQLPDAELVLNTYYDNEEGVNAFHNTWGPVFNQLLRDVALCQTRPVAVAEVFPEYAHLDEGLGQIVGTLGLICLDLFGLDGIRPTNTGYTVHVEKVWEALGGTDTLGATPPDVRLGLLEHIGTRFPTATSALGLGVANAGDALAQDGLAATLFAGAGELRLSGFDATASGLLRYARLSVRYRTSAAPADDAYRFEAALDGQFSAPGSTFGTWNTIVPIVGSSGDGGAVVLAFPDAPSYRTTGATLTAGAPVDGTSSVGWSDLASLEVRYEGLPTGAPDAFEVEWDAAWVDLYGVPPGRVFWEGDPAPGGSVKLHVTGTNGTDVAILYAALGTSPVPLPLPPFGDYLLDPATSFALGSGFVTSGGSYSITVPSVPDVSGLSLSLQGLRITGVAPLAGEFTPVETFEVP